MCGKQGTPHTVAELRERFGDRFVDSIWPRKETAEERRWLREAQEQRAAREDTDLLYETDGSEEGYGLDWLGDGGELGAFIG